MKAIGQNSKNKMGAVFIPRRNCEKVKEPVMPVADSLFAHHATAYEEDVGTVTVVTSAFDSYSLGHEFGFASDSNVFDPEPEDESAPPASFVQVKIFSQKKLLEQKNCWMPPLLILSKPIDGRAKIRQTVFCLRSERLVHQSGWGPFDQILKIDIEKVEGRWQCVCTVSWESRYLFQTSKRMKTAFQRRSWGVIAAVHDAIKATTFLVILDAEDVGSGPICY